MANQGTVGFFSGLAEGLGDSLLRHEQTQARKKEQESQQRMELWKLIYSNPDIPDATKMQFGKMAFQQPAQEGPIAKIKGALGKGKKQQQPPSASDIFAKLQDAMSQQGGGQAPPASTPPMPSVGGGASASPPASPQTSAAPTAIPNLPGVKQGEGGMPYDPGVSGGPPSGIPAMPNLQTASGRREAEFMRETQFQGQEKLRASESEFNQRVQEGQKIGLKGEQLASFVAGRNLGGMSSSFKVETRNVPGNAVKDATVDLFGKPIDQHGKYDRIWTGENFAYVASGTPATAAGKAPKALQPTGGGEPFAVQREGKNIMPGDPDFTPEDRKFLDSAIASYRNQQKAITDRQIKTMGMRYEMYLKRPMQVYKADGTLGFANALQINAAPDQYSPAAGALKVKNAYAVFGEIDATAGLVNKAISDLPDAAFSAEQRAKIALVMNTENPLGAWHNFVRSGFATTLTDKQIDYVTSLASLEESAMALRSVQGLGQGSDQLRARISAMLPGPGTPSKKYAQKQMQLFRVEVNALKKALPGIAGQAGGSPPQPSAGAGGGAKTAPIPQPQSGSDPLGVY